MPQLPQLSNGNKDTFYPQLPLVAVNETCLMNAQCMVSEKLLITSFPRLGIRSLLLEN